ncbi:Uncharacterised protein [Mycobacteroides abscessus subsp. abscessus]|nr:Uncharacterised protein [Mycobacteroides abscessus subsp. abscessus]
MAPLGFPVVPDVYMMSATVSSGMSISGRSDASSATRAA